jgi:UDP-N-acetylmuramate dehydrogenase
MGANGDEVTTVGLQALVIELGPRMKLAEPLGEYTAMRTGGRADGLVVCDQIDDLLHVLARARKHHVPWMVLGGGCNVLVADHGVRGLVVVCRAASIEIDRHVDAESTESDPNGPSETHSVWAEAGASLASVARMAASEDYAGLEWASGLPGSVGGAVVGNAGAFEGDVAGSLLVATVMDPSGHVDTKPAAWFEFDYRSSRLKGDGPDRHVLLSAEFKCDEGDPEQLGRTVDEILTWRRTRHPSGFTMGSTFKNPPGSHAGYLIEQAGLRGHRIGGALVSPMHGNFLMNAGGATSADVLALIDYVRAEVNRQFGIELELEIELVGW